MLVFCLANVNKIEIGMFVNLAPLQAFDPHRSSAGDPDCRNARTKNPGLAKQFINGREAMQLAAGGSLRGSAVNFFVLNSATSIHSSWLANFVIGGLEPYMCYS